MKRPGMKAWTQEWRRENTGQVSKPAMSPDRACNANDNYHWPDSGRLFLTVARAGQPEASGLVRVSRTLGQPHAAWSYRQAI